MSERFKDPPHIQKIRSLARSQRTERQQQIFIEYLQKKASRKKQVGRASVRKRAVISRDTLIKPLDASAKVSGRVSSVKKMRGLEAVEKVTHQQAVEIIQKIKTSIGNAEYTTFLGVFQSRIQGVSRELGRQVTLEQAVIVTIGKFQSESKKVSTVDGVLGPRTLRALYFDYYFSDKVLSDNPVLQDFQRFKRELVRYEVSDDMAQGNIAKYHNIALPLIQSGLSGTSLTKLRYLIYREVGGAYKASNNKDFHSYDPLKVFQRNDFFGNIGRSPEYIGEKGGVVMDARVSGEIPNTPDELLRLSGIKSKLKNVAFVVRDRKGKYVFIYYEAGKLKYITPTSPGSSKLGRTPSVLKVPTEVEMEVIRGEGKWPTRTMLANYYEDDLFKRTGELGSDGKKGGAMGYSRRLLVYRRGHWTYQGYNTHIGNVNGEEASHGCIRLPVLWAYTMFYGLKNGTSVYYRPKVRLRDIQKDQVVSNQDLVEGPSSLDYGSFGPIEEKVILLPQERFGSPEIFFSYVFGHVSTKLSRSPSLQKLISSVNRVGRVSLKAMQEVSVTEQDKNILNFIIAGYILYVHKRNVYKDFSVMFYRNGEFVSAQYRNDGLVKAEKVDQIGLVGGGINFPQPGGVDVVKHKGELTVIINAEL